MRVIFFEYMSPSGIAYSVNPFTRNPGEILIDANYGQITTILDGAVEPDRFVVAKDSLRIIARSLGAKEFVDILAEDPNNPQCLIVHGGAERCATAEKNRAVFCISDSQVIEVAKAVLKVERHFGQPMKVEWQFGGRPSQEEKLYVLGVDQMRD